jgi:hypothetical protein
MISEDATVVIKAGRVFATESNTILLRLFHTIQRRRRAAVLRSGPGGERDRCHHGVRVGRRRRRGVGARARVLPPGAFEEEVGEVLLRVGAVLVDARAMAVEEALRPSVAMAENLEEYTRTLTGAKLCQFTSARGTEQPVDFSIL